MPDSSSPWFYLDSEGAQQGPVTRTSIESLWASGELRRETLVWTNGMADWAPLGSVFVDMMPPPIPAHVEHAELFARMDARRPTASRRARGEKSPAGIRFLMFGLLVAMCTLITFFLRTGPTALLMLTEYPSLAVTEMSGALGYSLISIAIGAVLIKKDKVQVAFLWAGAVAVLFALLPQQ